MTYGTMQTRIADDLNKTNLTTEIKRAICTAMNRYRNKRFKFNYASSTFTTSDSQSIYPLPSGFMGDELVEVLDGNFKDVLTKVNYAWIANHDNHRSYKSEPRVYAIIDGNNMRLYPVPDNTANTTSGDFPLLIHYHKDLNASGASGAISISASDGVTNAWMTDGEELIRLEAMINIYTTVLRGKDSVLEIAKLKPERDAALRALVKEYNQSVASGTLEPYG